jgi:sugar lactone lactonase YvrE
MQRWTAELVLDARADLAEGPLWDPRGRELLWVDIMAGLFHRFDPATGNDVALDVAQPVGCVVLRAQGGWMLGLKDGFATADGTVELVARLDHGGRPDVRMNDGAVDSRGRFWAGTMQLDSEPGAGALYRLDPNGAVHTILTGVTISNGIAWSPDESVMYYVDTPTRRIDVFDWDVEGGSIRNRRPLVELEDGAGDPDGLVVDEEGCVWLALWDGSAVRRYAPDGELLGVVEVPAGRVTKPAFGGAALDELYVTTALGPEPQSGGVFRVRPGVRGLPPHAFAG